MLRKTVAALFVTLVAMLGMWVPSVSAAYVSSAKVVIIVGAVHGQTDSYRQRGDAAYAEAKKYTPNVTKVYSPNATWSKVKSATTGANIVIYMGHGNGWPSPYTYDPNYTTKDGFGLNATAGNGDNNVKYYGEPYVDDLALAPNAIILLHHLCYASGNSEPGRAAPSTTTAKARVDNYGAGFLRGKARAVIADGHAGAAYYLRALFTTNQSVLSVWRNAPNYNGNEFSFAGTRSTNARAYMDPDDPGKGFYRSLVLKTSGLTSYMVTGAVGDTSLDPGAFVVPGRASTSSAGAELLDATGAPAGTLPANERLAVVARPNWVAPDGIGVYEVTGLDDASIHGFVRATQLVPRDSMEPVAFAVGASPTKISPNGDGTLDTTKLSALFSETVDWTLTIRASDGTEVGNASGRHAEPSVDWDALVDGAAVPDGTYTYTFRGQDSWLNADPPVAKSGTVKVDTTPPTLSGVPAPSDPLPWFSPNGDGSRDTYALKATTSQSGKIEVRVRNADGDVVRRFSTDVSAGAFSIPWDGKDNDGAVVADGTYDVGLIPVDTLGNRGTAETIRVRSIALLRAVKTSKTVFYPQDRDALGTTTVLSFSINRPASVTWTIRNAKGDVVDTRYADAALEAGTHSLTYDGRTVDGVLLPKGKYTSHVTATDGDLTASQTVGFEMNAFAITSSTQKPKRGRSITIRAKPAEPLGGSVTMTISQPGKASWTVKMSKLSTGTYRATVTLKTGGSAGTLKISVQAKDSKGGRNKTYLKLPLS
jgi:flagellar hook assembly protein FlgD